MYEKESIVERSGRLVRKKYIEYLASTMAFSLSIYVAAIVDGILVGKLIGPEAFAAVNMSMPVVYVKNIAFCMFISGGCTLASQFMGARRFDDCNRVFTISLCGGVLFSLLLAIAGVLTAPALAGFLTASGELAQNVEAYLKPLWILAPLTVLTNGSAGFMRLESRHKLAASIPIVANVVNLMCDVLYIRVFGWGIGGAGWATVTGYAAAAFLLLPWLRSSDRSLRFVMSAFGDIKQTIEVIRVGMPISLIDACDMLRNYTVNITMLSILGAAGGQIISVCNAALLYATMIADGFATSMGTVVGALYGERDRKGILHVLKTALALSSGLCVLIFMLLELFSSHFAGIYGVRDGQILAILIPWMRIYCFAIPLIAPLYVLRCFYQATGHEDTATQLSVLQGAVFMIPIFYILSRVGTFAMAAAFAVSAAMSVAVVVIRMSRRAKREGCDSFLMLDPNVGSVWETSIGCTEQEAVEASKTLMEVCKKAGLSSSLSGAMSVSVEELCVNIARYSGLRANDKIDLFLGIAEDAVVLKVRDGGRIFNPTEYMEDGEMITGLKLIRALASKIEYHPIIGFNTTVVTCMREQSAAVAGKESGLS